MPGKLPDLIRLLTILSSYTLKYFFSKFSNICLGNQEGAIDPLPKHLKAEERLPLQENPESIYDKTSMGATSFSLFLHQNCLAFYSSIDNLGKALQHLTDSDVLSAEWTVSNSVS